MTIELSATSVILSFHFGMIVLGPSSGPGALTSPGGGFNGYLRNCERVAIPSAENPGYASQTAQGDLFDPVTFSFG
ncbi:hypothetical protein K32_44300 [Kaistia sp. 32K]|nr:hypothetical protein K32_44300 [Kaistia sp. 32K]